MPASPKEAIMPTQRLDKIISDTGRFTRSEASALIVRGRITVDGHVVKRAAEKFDPETVSISFDGMKLEYRKFRYIVMNKPAGYVSSTADRRDKTVLELLDNKYEKFGLFPAGRLDKDAEGLLILTNDGGLAHNIMAPSKKVNKRYFVRFSGEISDGDITAFADGLVLGDGTKCLPAVLEPAQCGAYVTLREGKYHQVKRMMSAIGKPVSYLRRIAIGGLKLDENLKPGEYCEITDEIKRVFDDK